MYYVCQLMFDKGKRMPLWQTAFGHRYAGLLTIAYEHMDEGFKLPVARLQRLPGQAQTDTWPKPLYGVSTLEEDREARYVTGSELNHSPTADRYLTQVWKLTPLTVDQWREVTEYEAAQARRESEALNNQRR
ncbi:hypothetical protein [Propionivibrio soli]|uniref:hypothetical protein n=1 Tax=Propionivibrio soli TaxID=2976531 RepID=UPI0021E7B6AD|nr:hypothetical protein [Propionivibrio soli]